MAIQTSVRSELEQYVAGQIANTIPAKCESGVLTFASGQNDNNKSLAFGRACQYTGDRQVNTGVARAAIGHAGGGSTSTTLVMNLVPGAPRPSVGSTLFVGTDDCTISAVANNGNYTVTGLASAPSAGTAISMLNGGRTTFAGVAVRATNLPGVNSPVDTYNEDDHVNIGAEGDFVVQVKGAVSRGDGASVNLSTANDYADYGKFGNATDSSTAVGIPGAVFMTDAADGALAVLRLTKQAG